VSELPPNAAPSEGPPEIWLIILLPFIFAVVFPLFWCFVMKMLSFAGGWKRLAARYQTEEKPTGKLFSGVQGQIGLVSYRGVLECTTNAEGFFLRPGFLFRFAHPLIFIPWSECHEVTRSHVIWMKWIRADIGETSVATIRLAARVFEESEGQVLLK